LFVVSGIHTPKKEMKDRQEEKPVPLKLRSRVSILFLKPITRTIGRFTQTIDRPRKG